MCSFIACYKLGDYGIHLLSRLVVVVTDILSLIRYYTRQGIVIGKSPESTSDFRSQPSTTLEHQILLLVLQDK